MIGQVIGGRYQIEAELGAGGMGTVYRALDTQTQAVVALKHLTSDYADAELIERFKREGEALRDLNHPNIVKMLNTLEDAGQHYLIMEYVTGGDLSDLLKQGELALERCLKLSLDLADALTRAHKLDIIHRDLKPANVLIAEDGTLRLTDFGVARIGKKQRVTDTDAIVGTVDYLAPETLDGSEIDPRADIWAFGVMLFEMLAGERPFKGETVTQTLMHIMTQPTPDLEAKRSDAPVALVDLVYRMLEKSRDARIRSVRQVGLELEDILHGRTTQTPPETRFAPDTPNILTRPKHNLPAQTSPFVGREHELSEVAKLVANPKIRLMTILAPGGMGKTRLALEAAEQQIAQFENGVYFVELAPLSDPANIVSAIAEATGYQFQGDGREQKQQILDFLKNKNMLLVLDNYEHLLDGAGLVTDILKAAPDVQILATSRQRLSQSGETLFHLSGMDFPDWETPADAMNYAAVKLFMNSAQRAQPLFELTSDNLDYVARICRLVQGMPLGIVLAASWLAMLTPEEIADEIQQSIDFLTDEAGEVPDRQRSIRAVFDYAWEQMTQAEQDVFMKLSVFRGGFTREAAQEVAGANLRVLMSLVNKSLLRRNADSGRYEVHELLRQYTQQRLKHQAELNSKTVNIAHMKHFAHMLERLGSELKDARQRQTLQMILTDFENIRLAWLYAVEIRDKASLIRMMESIRLFCFMKDREIVAIEIFGRARADLVSTNSIPELTDNLRALSSFTGLENPQPVVEEALRIAVSKQEDIDAAWCYRVLAHHARRRGDANASEAYLNNSIGIYKKLGYRFELGDTLYRLALTIMPLGRVLESAQIAQEVIDLHAHGKNEFGIVLAKMGVGNALSYSGLQLEFADAQLESAFTTAMLMKNQGLVMGSSGMLSLLRLCIGKLDDAKHFVKQSLRIADDLNDKFHINLWLHHDALIAVCEGDFTYFDKILEEIQPFNSLMQFWIDWSRAMVSVFQKDSVTSQLHVRTSIQLLIKSNMADRPSTPRFFALILFSAYFTLSDAKRAIELRSLTFIHPLQLQAMMNSIEWLNSIFSRIEDDLGEKEYQLAWERGKSLDLETVVKELLEEFAVDD